jgi:hypothetical protein
VPLLQLFLEYRYIGKWSQIISRGRPTGTTYASRWCMSCSSCLASQVGLLYKALHHQDLFCPLGWHTSGLQPISNYSWVRNAFLPSNGDNVLKEHGIPFGRSVLAADFADLCGVATELDSLAQIHAGDLLEDAVNAYKSAGVRHQRLIANLGQAGELAFFFGLSCPPRQNVNIVWHSLFLPLVVNSHPSELTDRYDFGCKYIAAPQLGFIIGACKSLAVEQQKNGLSFSAAVRFVCFFSVKCAGLPNYSIALLNKKNDAPICNHIFTHDVICYTPR